MNEYRLSLPSHPLKFSQTPIHESVCNPGPDPTPSIWTPHRPLTFSFPHLPPPPTISACATEPCLHCFYYPIQSSLDRPWPHSDITQAAQRYGMCRCRDGGDYSCRRGRRTRSTDVEFGRARLLRRRLGDIKPASLTNCRMQKAMQVWHASVPDVCTVPALKKV